MTSLYAMLLALAVSGTAAATSQKLDEIPSTRFRISNQSVRLTQLSDISVQEIVVTETRAILNSGRILMTLEKGESVPQAFRPEILPAEVNWFAPVCRMGDAFVLGAHDFPEDIKARNEETPRGGFRAAPASLGFLLLMPIGDTRYLKDLLIVRRPQQTSPAQANDTGNSFSIFATQSCAWDGTALVIGSYGALGKADFDNGTIDIVDEDPELAFNRSPVLAEREGTWVGLDEGGLGGAVLSWRPNQGKPQSFEINDREDIVSYSALVRHRGSLFVGTSHGLFRLDEDSGSFDRLDLGDELSGKPVTGLASYRKRLWVFIGDEWLGIDIENRQAVRYINSTPVKLTTGAPFDGGWLLAGPEGVWRSQGDTGR